MAKGKAKAIEKRPVRSAAAKGKAKMPAAKEKPLHFTKMAIPVSECILLNASPVRCCKARSSYAFLQIAWRRCIVHRKSRATR